MSEYIVQVPDEQAEQFMARFGIEGTQVFGFQLTGEIVRCRDCRYMNERHYRDMLGFGRETIVYRCDYFWNADELPEVEPDGFCAWAERKEGE